jgi:hypothetical protein
MFGLGNKQYRVYQAVSRLFDKKFQELGGIIFLILIQQQIFIN